LVKEKFGSRNGDILTFQQECCLGPVFLPILCTGKVCDIQLFSDNYKPMENILVVTNKPVENILAVTRVTAYDDEEFVLTFSMTFVKGYHLSNIPFFNSYIVVCATILPAICQLNPVASHMMCHNQPPGYY
jgi:hypothetical protein